MPEQRRFDLVSAHQPAGDQPKAIQQLVDHIESGIKHQVLLGVTGSGKTFTLANMIAALNRPTLVMAHNKTLAAQLYAEFRELFPNNAVEYFVSYYDYYQPEAYIPASDTYIEKDSAINEQIDRMRHSATRSLFERSDVIIVSSVSCIYGLGSAEEYENMVIDLTTGLAKRRDDLLRDLIKIQYRRQDVDFHRGTFRVRGDLVEVYPAYEEDRVIRIEFFGDYIDSLSWADPLRGVKLSEMTEVSIYPGSHYVTSRERLRMAIDTIRDELRERLQFLRDEIRHKEAERLEQRTQYDLELLQEMGFCPGIENYSRHLTGRRAGEPPPTLLEYFPKDFITVIDESHVTVPQIGAMYRGDRARKTTLVEHGFRLPSALDNRPLNFSEFEGMVDSVVYVSATPGQYEIQKSGGLVVEQVIRPTGLLDPLVHVRPARHQVDDLLNEIRQRIARRERVLVTTLTKRSAEDLTEYYESVGIKVKYLHSDIQTVERTEILRDLRLGVFDVLVGINLLREGLDLPEVSLVGITDADKEGFLRSERSLIQTIGRAARNSRGEVILYADQMTESMKKAISETERRRTLQEAYNRENGLEPKTISKPIHGALTEVFGYDFTASDLGPEATRVMEKAESYQRDPKGIEREVKVLRKQMKKAADDLDFETAARLRDEIKRLEVMQLGLLKGTSDDEVGSS